MFGNSVQKLTARAGDGADQEKGRGKRWSSLVVTWQDQGRISCTDIKL